MPLELADIEASTLENIAILAANRRDILADESLPDVRAAVAVMKASVLSGKVPTGINSAQNSRVNRLVRKGATLSYTSCSYVLTAKDGVELLVDQRGRLFYPFTECVPKPITKDQLTMALSDCEKCWNTPCTCGYQYRNWAPERKAALVAAIMGAKDEEPSPQPPPPPEAPPMRIIREGVDKPGRLK